jgi:tetratricopeptide (TPR) repeat protein
MEELKGRPKVKRGSPPTPANPYPSNQIVKEYANGISVISTPRPNKKVLAEYEQALTNTPDDAGLHLHYGIALKYASRRKEAQEQMEVAIGLRPEWDFPHSQLAGLLEEAGDYQAALSEMQIALELHLQSEGQQTEQGEAILRWGLAQALQKVGRVTEAHEQVQQAVTLQQSVVNQHRGSLQLLQQIEEARAEVASAQP